MLRSVALLCLFGAGTTGLLSSGAEQITVSAALSLANAMEEIGQAWTQAGGVRVRFNFAASNTLARQIVNGAPVDVFISADEAQMDVVEKAGVLIAGSRAPVIRNQLAVAASPPRAAFVRENFFRAPPEIRRLALGDPDAVPAGVYAKQYLEQRGLWSAYAARVVPTANVRAALAAVENGSADAAIVYASDIRAARGAVQAFSVPIGEGPPILYPGAVVKSSRQRAAAERFLAFLRTADAQALFARHGFLPLASR
jgi:molybdate transport system substrate-binding protein